MKRQGYVLLAILAIVSTLMSACATPTPEVIKETVVVEKEVTKVVTQVVKETVKETVIVKGTPQVVEKEVTRIVEKVVTPKAAWAPRGQVIFATEMASYEDMNPLTTANQPPKSIAVNVAQPLVFFDDNLLISTDHALAEAWEASDDGLIYTYHLRKEAVWTDGTPVTAADVKFTYEAAMKPETAFWASAQFEVIKQIETPDDHTVKIHLTEPVAAFNTYLIYISILPKHVLEGEDLHTHPYRRMMDPANGPFKIIEHSADFMVLEANDKYYGDPPGLQKVIFKDAVDRTTHPALLLAGEVDFATYDKETYEAALKGKGFKLFAYPPLNVNGFWWNIDNPLFQDKRVREALAYAVDRETIIEIASGGDAILAHTWWRPDFWAHNPDVRKITYDPQKALDLLEEAGWTKNDKGVLVNAEGEPFTFTLFSFGKPGRDLYETTVVARQNWEDIGMQVNFEGAPDWASWYARAEKGDYDISEMGFGSGIDPSTDFATVFRCGKGMLGLRYCNEEVDRLFLQGRTETDLEKRKEIYDEIQVIVMDDLWFFPVSHRIWHYVVRENVEGIVSHPLGYRWFLWKVYVTED